MTTRPIGTTKFFLFSRTVLKIFHTEGMKIVKNKNEIIVDKNLSAGCLSYSMEYFTWVMDDFSTVGSMF